MTRERGKSDAGSPSLMAIDRFFTITHLGNRIDIRGIPEWGSWNAERIEWVTEPEVDAVLLPLAGDRKVRTPEELEAGLQEPLTDATPARRLWVHERLLEIIRTLWEQQSKRPQ
jgi:hypothetical protein